MAKIYSMAKTCATFSTAKTFSTTPSPESTRPERRHFRSYLAIKSRPAIISGGGWDNANDPVVANPKRAVPVVSI
jgi:hypothetical protein